MKLLPTTLLAGVASVALAGTVALVTPAAAPGPQLPERWVITSGFCPGPLATISVLWLQKLPGDIVDTKL